MNVAARREDHGDYRNGRELEHATIRVAKVDQLPLPTGKKMGGVMDAITKGWFKAYPKILQNLAVGQVYEIEFSQGDNARFIDSFMPVSESAEDRAAAAVQAAVAQSARAADNRDHTPENKKPQPVPARLLMSELTKDELIFIEGAFNRAIQNNQVNVNSLDEMIRVRDRLHRVWITPIEE